MGRLILSQAASVARKKSRRLCRSVRTIPVDGFGQDAAERKAARMAGDRPRIAGKDGPLVYWLM
jgi:hypothetical protein